MVAGAVVAAGTIIATGGLAAPAVLAGASAGATAGAGVGTATGMAAATGAMTAGASAAAAGATGAAAGTIAGAAGTATAAAGTAAGLSATTAAVGSAAGGVAGASTGASLSGMFAFGAGTGGWGFLALGAEQNSNGSNVTYDCWKQVVHDTSPEPSNGMLMKDVVRHPYVSKVTMGDGPTPTLPCILLENVWNERFEIDYVMVLETGKIACHAKRIME